MDIEATHKRDALKMCKKLIPIMNEAELFEIGKVLRLTEIRLFEETLKNNKKNLNKCDFDLEVINISKCKNGGCSIIQDDICCFECDKIDDCPNKCGYYDDGATFDMIKEECDDYTKEN